MKILIAADGSPYSRRILDYVAAQPKLFSEDNDYTKVTTTHRVGHPAEVIAKTATAGGYDMVVMGSHGHAALGNLVMGSITNKVLAHCKTPMLIVR